MGFATLSVSTVQAHVTVFQRDRFVISLSSRRAPPKALHILDRVTFVRLLHHRNRRCAVTVLCTTFCRKCEPSDVWYYCSSTTSANSAMRIEGGSGATAPATYWDLANLEHSLVSVKVLEEAVSDKDIIHDRKISSG